MIIARRYARKLEISTFSDLAALLRRIDAHCRYVMYVNYLRTLNKIDPNDIGTYHGDYI